MSHRSLRSPAHIELGLDVSLEEVHMTTKTKKKKATTRKKAAPKPKVEVTKPVEAEAPVDQQESVPTCPECGSPMIRRSGKFGPFYGCSRFTSGECKATIKIEQ